MKKVQSLFSLFFLLLLITACSDDNKTNILPEVQYKQITLDLISHDGSIDLGENPKYELLNELPEWLNLELISENSLYRLRFFAASAADERRTTEFEISRTTGNIKVRVVQNPVQQKGLFILSEAGWGQSKADIAYYDELTQTLHPKYFSEINGRTLGDVGNDMAIYGTKMYVVVSGTNTESKNSYIEVINPMSLKSIKQIPFIIDKANDIYDLPRRIIFEEGKGYITGFTGIVARLDTLNLEIEAFAKLGEGATHSEGLTHINGKLYVCNSGYGKGKTISVVDMKSFKETNQIEVSQNPVNITTASNGKVYFQTAQLFDQGVPSNLYELDPITDEVSYTFNVPAGKLAILNGVLYTGDFSWTTYTDTMSMINLETKVVTDLTLKSKQMLMAYSFDASPATNQIYIGSQGDDVATINANGQFISKVKVKVPYINKVVSIIR